jgi:hypothetical protein
MVSAMAAKIHIGCSLVLLALLAWRPATAADAVDDRELRALMESHSSRTVEVSWACWVDFPFGPALLNTRDANRAVASFDGKLNWAGLGFGFLPSMRVGRLAAAFHFSISASQSSRDAQFELAAADGVRRSAQSGLSLAQTEVGADVGYVVWVAYRTFLYPILGLHRYDQTLQWSSPDHPGQYAHAMSKTGLGLFISGAIHRYFDRSPGADNDQTRAFIGLRIGTLLHLAHAELYGVSADVEPRPSLGALQSGVLMVSLGIGYAQP